MPVADCKTFKVYGNIWLWKKKRYQNSHSLFLQTGILPSSSCVSILIFNLTSQIDIEWCRLCCFMGYSQIASWCGFPPYWRSLVDFVDPWSVLVWSIRTKQSNNSKLHLRPRKSEFVHSLFLQTGNLPSSSCVSIIIFNLTSQLDTAWYWLCCFMGLYNLREDLAMEEKHNQDFI
jgi:hypothetical protein